jgi:diguanylate cyclase (GGDEF)-like protein
MPAPALAAFALTAALACAAAAFAARLLGAGALASGLLVGGVAVGYGACGLAVVHHARRRADHEADELDELTRLLGSSTSEAQARRLLLRYVHAVAPRAGAVLLSCAEPAQELELTFGERILDTPLRGLAGARLASSGCRAIELGSAREVTRSVQGEHSEANVECTLCGQLAGELACEPLRGAGGEAGALLVSGARISSTARALIREAVRRAAPVLIMRREQAAAERRAGSDPLTALPNRPAAEQALRRLCAQAGRTISPLAAVLLGLDRPPRRRAEREQAIALVGRQLTSAARASDFIARFDAHTFLVLAPDTDREGGLELAEKLRRGLELLTQEADGPLTASLGVAALPMDALAPEGLLRQADRALQVARALGGNRVQAAESTFAP